MALHSEVSELTLTAPPSVAAPLLAPAPGVAAAQEGDDVVLTVPLAPHSGLPTHVTWTRGDVELVGERFSSVTQRGAVTLNVRNATVGDSGRYTLSARNDAGHAHSDLLLEVRTRPGDVPVFLRRLNDLAVKVGTRTRFLVEIRSPTQVKVSWEQEGKPIFESERFHLLHEGNFFCVDVAPVTLEDAGLWICRAHNSNGTATCFCHLNVLVPKAYKAPHFIEELVAILTEQGTVSLECKVVGVPTPTLRWFKDNQEIKAGDVFALSADPADATSLGTYTCEAANCMGRAHSTSRVHVLSKDGKVQPVDSLVPKGPAPVFSKELRNEKVKIGEKLILSCKVSVPPWPKSITWFNKSGLVETGGRYHILEDGLGAYSVEVDPVEASDEGEWKCVATSDHGVKGITTCNVSVSYPKNYKKPKFLESLKAILTEEGLVSFECKVVGYPTPQLRWFKDGQELKPGDVYQLTGTNSLGSYCCIARNCMGETSSTAELTVEDIQSQLSAEERLQLFSRNQPPHFLQGLKSLEAKIMDPLRLTVQVSVSPQPTVAWFRDDEQVQESDRYKAEQETKGFCHLSIKRLELVDQAEWKCVATNDYGQSVTSCFLKLSVPRHYKKPRFLENLRAVLSEEGAVNLECKVIGVPQPTLKWYKDGRELKPGDIHRIISGQDGTCCLGTYTCEATNCMGTVASSASLLGFEDRAQVKPQTEPVRPLPPATQLTRHPSLSTIQEERTSQLHDTVNSDERAEVSFSFDGKEVSVSLYETPDLTEEEALQVVEMYAEELSEHISEHNVVELPPMRFVKETSQSGHLLMEAVVIDVSPEYYASAEDRTEADLDEFSITEDNGFMSPQVLTPEEMPFEKFTSDFLERTAQLQQKAIPVKPPRKRGADNSESSYHSLKEAKLSPEEESSEFADALSSIKDKSQKDSFSSAKSGAEGLEEKSAGKIEVVPETGILGNLHGVDSKSSESKKSRKKSRSRSRSAEIQGVDNVSDPSSEKKVPKRPLKKRKSTDSEKEDDSLREFERQKSLKAERDQGMDIEKLPKRDGIKKSKSSESEKEDDSLQEFESRKRSDKGSEIKTLTKSPTPKKPLSDSSGREDDSLIEYEKKKVTSEGKSEKASLKIDKSDRQKAPLSKSISTDSSEKDEAFAIKSEQSDQSRKRKKRSIKKSSSTEKKTDTPETGVEIPPSSEAESCDRDSLKNKKVVSSSDLDRMRSTSDLESIGDKSRAHEEEEHSADFDTAEDSAYDKSEMSVLESLTHSIKEIKKGLAAVEERVISESTDEPQSAKSSLSAIESLVQPINEIQRSLIEVEKQAEEAEAGQYSPSSILETLKEPIQELGRTLSEIEKVKTTENGDEPLLKRTSQTLLETVSHPLQELQKELTFIQQQAVIETGEETFSDMLQSFKPSLLVVQGGVEQTEEGFTSKVEDLTDVTVLPQGTYAQQTEQTQSIINELRDSETVDMKQNDLFVPLTVLDVEDSLAETAVSLTTLGDVDLHNELGIFSEKLIKVLGDLKRSADNTNDGEIKDILIYLGKLITPLEQFKNVIEKCVKLVDNNDKSNDPQVRSSNMVLKATLESPVHALGKCLHMLETVACSKSSKEIRGLGIKILYKLSFPLEELKTTMKLIENLSEHTSIELLVTPVESLISAASVINLEASKSGFAENIPEEGCFIVNELEATVRSLSNSVASMTKALPPQSSLSTLSSLTKPLVDFQNNLNKVVNKIKTQEQFNTVTTSEIYNLAQDLCKPLQAIRTELSIAQHEIELDQYSHLSLLCDPSQDNTLEFATNIIHQSLEQVHKSVLTSTEFVLSKSPSETLYARYLLFALNELILPLNQLNTSVVKANESLSEVKKISDPNIGISTVTSSASELLTVLAELHKHSVTTVGYPEFQFVQLLCTLKEPLMQVESGLCKIIKHNQEEDKTILNINILKTLAEPFKFLQKSLINIHEELGSETVSQGIFSELRHPIQELQRSILIIQDQVSFEYGDEPASIESNIVTLQSLVNPLNALKQQFMALDDLIVDQTQSTSYSKENKNLHSIIKASHELQLQLSSIMVEENYLNKHSLDSLDMFPIFQDLTSLLRDFENALRRVDLICPNESKADINVYNKLCEAVKSFSQEATNFHDKITLASNKAINDVKHPVHLLKMGTEKFITKNAEITKDLENCPLDETSITLRSLKCYKKLVQIYNEFSEFIRDMDKFSEGIDKDSIEMSLLSSSDTIKDVNTIMEEVTQTRVSLESVNILSSNKTPLEKIHKEVKTFCELLKSTENSIIRSLKSKDNLSNQPDKKPTLVNAFSSLINQLQRIEKFLVGNEESVEAASDLKKSLDIIQEHLSFGGEISEVYILQNLSAPLKNFKVSISKALDLVHVKSEETQSTSSYLERFEKSASDLELGLMKLEHALLNSTGDFSSLKNIDIDVLAHPIEELVCYINRIEEQHNVFESFESLADQSSLSMLKTLAQPIREIQEGVLLIQEQIALDAGGKTPSGKSCAGILYEIAKPIRELRSGVALIQEQIVMEPDVEPLSEETRASSLQTFAAPIEEIKKMLTTITEQQPLIFEADVQSMSEDISLLKTIAQPVKELQNKLASIEINQIMESGVESFSVKQNIIALAKPVQTLQESIAVVESQMPLETAGEDLSLQNSVTMLKKIAKPLLEIAKGIAVIYEQQFIEEGNQDISTISEFSTLANVTDVSFNDVVVHVGETVTVEHGQSFKHDTIVPQTATTAIEDNRSIGIIEQQQILLEVDHQIENKNDVKFESLKPNNATLIMQEVLSSVQVQEQETLSVEKTLTESEEKTEHLAKLTEESLNMGVQAEQQESVVHLEKLSTDKPVEETAVGKDVTLNIAAQVEVQETLSNVEKITSNEDLPISDIEPDTVTPCIIQGELQQSLADVESLETEEETLESLSIQDTSFKFEPLINDIQEALSNVEDLLITEKTLDKAEIKSDIREAVQNEKPQMLDKESQLKSLDVSSDKANISVTTPNEAAEAEMQQVISYLKDIETVKYSSDLANFGEVSLQSALQVECQQVLSDVGTLKNESVSEKCSQAIALEESHINVAVKTEVQEFFSVVDKIEEITNELQVKVTHEPIVNEIAKEEVQQVLQFAEEMILLKEAIQTSIIENPNIDVFLPDINQVLSTCEKVEHLKDTLQEITQKQPEILKEMENLSLTKILETPIDTLPINVPNESDGKIDSTGKVSNTVLPDKPESKAQNDHTSSSDISFQEKEFSAEKSICKQALETQIEHFVTAVEDMSYSVNALEAKLISNPAIKHAMQQEFQEILSTVNDIKAAKEIIKASENQVQPLKLATEVEIQQVLLACNRFEKLKNIVEATLTSELEVYHAIESELNQILSTADTFQTIKQSLSVTAATVQVDKNTVNEKAIIVDSPMNDESIKDVEIKTAQQEGETEIITQKVENVSRETKSPVELSLEDNKVQAEVKVGLHTTNEKSTEQSKKENSTEMKLENTKDQTKDKVEKELSIGQKKEDKTAKEQLKDSKTEVAKIDTTTVSQIKETTKSTEVIDLKQDDKIKSKLNLAAEKISTEVNEGKVKSEETTSTDAETKEQKSKIEKSKSDTKEFKDKDENPEDQNKPESEVAKMSEVKRSKKKVEVKDDVSGIKENKEVKPGEKGKVSEISESGDLSKDKAKDKVGPKSDTETKSLKDDEITETDQLKPEAKVAKKSEEKKTVKEELKSDVKVVEENKEVMEQKGIKKEREDSKPKSTKLKEIVPEKDEKVDAKDQVGPKSEPETKGLKDDDITEKDQLKPEVKVTKKSEEKKTEQEDEVKSDVKVVEENKEVMEKKGIKKESEDSKLKSTKLKEIVPEKDEKVDAKYQVGPKSETETKILKDDNITEKDQLKPEVKVTKKSEENKTVKEVGVKSDVKVVEGNKEVKEEKGIKKESEDSKLKSTKLKEIVPEKDEKVDAKDQVSPKSETETKSLKDDDVTEKDQLKPEVKVTKKSEEKKTVQEVEVKSDVKVVEENKEVMEEKGIKKESLDSNLKSANLKEIVPEKDEKVDAKDQVGPKSETETKILKTDDITEKDQLKPEVKVAKKSEEKKTVQEVEVKSDVKVVDENKDVMEEKGIKKESEDSKLKSTKLKETVPEKDEKVDAKDQVGPKSETETKSLKDDDITEKNQLKPEVKVTKKSEEKKTVKEVGVKSDVKVVEGNKEVKEEKGIKKESEDSKLKSTNLKETVPEKDEKVDAKDQVGPKSETETKSLKDDDITEKNQLKPEVKVTKKSEEKKTVMEVGMKSDVKVVEGNKEVKEEKGIKKESEDSKLKSTKLKETVPEKDEKVDAKDQVGPKSETETKSLKDDDVTEKDQLKPEVKVTKKSEEKKTVQEIEVKSDVKVVDENKDVMEKNGMKKESEDSKLKSTKLKEIVPEKDEKVDAKDQVGPKSETETKSLKDDDITEKNQLKPEVKVTKKSEEKKTVQEVEVKSDVKVVEENKEVKEEKGIKKDSEDSKLKSKEIVPGKDEKVDGQAKDKVSPKSETETKKLKDDKSTEKDQLKPETKVAKKSEEKKSIKEVEVKGDKKGIEENKVKEEGAIKKGSGDSKLKSTEVEETVPRKDEKDDGKANVIPKSETETKKLKDEKDQLKPGTKVKERVPEEDEKDNGQSKEKISLKSELESKKLKYDEEDKSKQNKNKTVVLKKSEENKGKTEVEVKEEVKVVHESNKIKPVEREIEIYKTDTSSETVSTKKSSTISNDYISDTEKKEEGNIKEVSEDNKLISTEAEETVTKKGKKDDGQGKDKVSPKYETETKELKDDDDRNKKYQRSKKVKKGEQEVEVKEGMKSFKVNDETKPIEKVSEISTTVFDQKSETVEINSFESNKDTPTKVKEIEKLEGRLDDSLKLSEESTVVKGLQLEKEEKVEDKSSPRETTMNKKQEVVSKKRSLKKQTEKSNLDDINKDVQQRPITVELEAKDKLFIVENEGSKHKNYLDESSTSDYGSESYSESYQIKKSQSYDTRQWVSDSKSRAEDSTPRMLSKHVREKKYEETGLAEYEKISYSGRQTASKPLFCGRLVDRTAAQGSRLKVTCSLTGMPDPTVQWFKDGHPVDTSLDHRIRTRLSNGLASLEIVEAKVGDSGKYTCTARNTHGEASTMANIKVFSFLESAPEAPVFTQHIRDHYKSASDELVVECRVKGHPQPSVTWSKDGHPLRPLARYEQSVLTDGTCRLVVHGPEPSDSGLYKCVAENAVWSEQTSAHVMFEGREKYIAESRSLADPKLPRFTNIASDTVVREGGTVALQVAVKGSPRAEVTWYRGSEPLPKRSSRFRYLEDAGVFSLVMTEASVREAGTYTCRASNAYGYRDTSVNVEVVGSSGASAAARGKPAMFVSRPDTSMAIAVGEDITLSFRVTGDPKPRVTWMKGMKDITNNIRTLKETINDYVRLTLKHATVLDAGTYFIMAKNIYGADHAFVTVRVKQRARSLTPTRTNIWSGPDTSTILRDIHESTRALVNDVPGPVSSPPVVSDCGKNWLSLAWGKPEHRGAAPVLAYRVEAWLVGTEGGAKWSELGVTPINSFDVFFLKPGSEYQFRVTARNRYGWGESVTTTEPISVGSVANFPPDIVRDLPGPLKALQGDNVTLECEISGDPPPTVQWLKDGHNVGTLATLKDRVFVSDDQLIRRLIVKQLTEDDSGRYVCEAVNKLGRASTYARLLVVTDPRLLDADRKLKESLVEQQESAPQFTMRLRDRRVQQSYPVRLSCQVVGSPTPVVSWACQGRPVTADDQHQIVEEADHFHTLEICRTQLEDCGEYTATAHNCLGAVTCRCQLIVDKGIRAYISPEFILELDPAVTVKADTELRLFAQVEAYPTVSISWQRDGVRLRPSRRLVMTLDPEGRVELALAHMTVRDAGLYTCTATNAVGRAETVCQVFVTGGTPAAAEVPAITTSDLPYSKEPRFVTKPRSSEAVEGDTVVITCEVVGDPQPEVMWLRDWLKPGYYRDAPQFRQVSQVTGGSHYSLEIPQVKLDFTGTYCVIARNTHGEAKAIISLQIYAKGQGKESSMVFGHVKHGQVETLPEIKRELKDVRCCDGDTVTLECLVSATPLPSVRWEKDGKILPLGDDIEAELDGEVARLTIRKVYPEDEGQYSCVAYNNLGRAVTSACLVVDVPEEKETLLSQQLTRPPGLLSARSTPRSTPRHTPSPARSLSPTPARYREFSSPSFSRPKRVKMSSPKFYTVPHNRIAEEGETVRFQCSVAGHPTPWASWDKDGHIVTPSSRLSVSERDDLRTLELREVTVEDAGLYRVTLENEMGSVEATARLDIIGRQGSRTRSVRAWSGVRSSPTFGRRLVGSAARVGGTFTLTCDVHATPSPVTSWYRNGEMLVKSPRVVPSWDGRRARLELRGLQPEDAGRPGRQSDCGVYTCVAENAAGTTQCSAELRVLQTTDPSDADLQPPVFLQGLPPEQTVPEGQPFELQVRLQGSSPLEVVWVKDGAEVPDCPDLRHVDYGDGRFGLRIADMFVADGGCYNCEAFNDHGDAITSGHLIVNDLSGGESRSTEPEIMFTKTPSPVLARLRGQASFCARLQSRPLSHTSFTWTVNGRSVNNDDRFTVTTEEDCSILRITDVHPSDMGPVVCTARVCCPAEPPTTVSCDTTLGLDGAPGAPAELLRGPCDTTAMRGDRVLLKATYRGDPEPAVRWLKAGRELSSEDRVQITSRDGVSCLTISAIDADDSGKYVVSVENIHGADCHFASVAVEGPPEAPAARPSVSAAGPDCVTVAWSSPPYDGGCVITGYRVEMRTALSHQWNVVADRCHSLSVAVRGLTPGQTYLFRVRAENIHGASDSSAESFPFMLQSPNTDLRDEEGDGEGEVESEEAVEPKLVTLEPGEQFLERYSVHEELGKGRYGVVHKVTDLRTGHTMAAKFVRCIKKQDREKVQEEIDIMNCLRHPKLLQLAAAFENPKDMVMVMEYISGGELFERVVADDFTLTERDCILFLRQICEGVRYMHTCNVVHLDLKPENIMCHTRTSHRVKIIDFGLAQKLASNTPVRVMFGTPEFIPPEIINYEPIGVESDMWSVGVICYVLLSGLSPFMGDNDAETFANITRADFDFDDEAFEAISEDAKDFISSLLVKRKEKRLTAEECLRHKWLTQSDTTMSSVKLCTDKLKKFIIRRKWQKTGNAIRALGRMATLSAASRRSSSASNPPSPRPSLSASRLSSVGEETKRGRVCSERSDSGISDCSVNTAATPPTPATPCHLLSKKYSICEEPEDSSCRLTEHGVINKLHPSDSVNGKPDVSAATKKRTTNSLRLDSEPAKAPSPTLQKDAKLFGKSENFQKAFAFWKQ